MKLLPIFLLCCAVVVRAEIKPPSGMQKRIMGYASECRKEGDVPVEEITLLMQRKVPTSEKGKCFLFCVHKKMGFQTDDGKKDEATIKTYIEELKKSDAEFGEKVEKLLDICWTAADQSQGPCDVAAQTFACYLKTMAEVGLKGMR